MTKMEENKYPTEDLSESSVPRDIQETVRSPTATGRLRLLTPGFSNFSNIEIDGGSRKFLPGESGNDIDPPQVVPTVELDRVADELPQERDALSGNAEFQTGSQLSHNPQPLSDEETLGGGQAFAPSSGGKDSGYGSLKTEPMVHGNLSTIQEGQEAVVTCDQEDSYSNASSLLRHPDTDKYISAFAEDLFCSLSAEFDVNGWEKVSSGIPFLLKSFAVRLGYERDESMQRELMYLVHKFRR